MYSDICSIGCIKPDFDAADFDFDFVLSYKTGWIVKYRDGSVKQFSWGQLPQDISDRILSLDFCTYSKKGLTWYEFKVRDDLSGGQPV